MLAVTTPPVSLALGSRVVTRHTSRRLRSVRTGVGICEVGTRKSLGTLSYKIKTEQLGSKLTKYTLYRVRKLSTVEDGTDVKSEEHTLSKGQ